MKAINTSIRWRPVATHPVAATVAGVIATVVVGLALVPFRETLGAVNAALVMAGLIVVSAEFGGRLAGVVVGVVGSLVFNVLHTRPYLEFVIERADEAVAAVMLVAFGLLIGSWHRPSEPDGRDS